MDNEYHANVCAFVQNSPDPPTNRYSQSSRTLLYIIVVITFSLVTFPINRFVKCYFTFSNLQLTSILYVSQKQLPENIARACCDK